MKRKIQGKMTGLAALAIVGFALCIPPINPAEARTMSMVGGGDISVSVGFSTQMPLADTTDQTLASTQKRGRTFIYRMARDECAVLKATIAGTCRLASLNVNARLNNPRHNQPVTLHINGNARYLISLKKF